METLLFIDGAETAAHSGDTIAVDNPTTGEILGTVARAGPADLERAVAVADRALDVWRLMSPLERCRIMRAGAAALRACADDIAATLALEVGKPLSQGLAEVNLAADNLEWGAEEGRRAYGRVVPARDPDVLQLVIRQPVGIVAAFTPWNFPVNQAARKIASALGAGCSVILKAAEEAPASAAKLVRTLNDAGLPKGVLNLVFGMPGEISEYLLTHQKVAKIAFTGSTAVGKRLSALAGAHMKRSSMELGGHSPVFVFGDADLGEAVAQLVPSKYRNAGQICTSPTRFFVQRQVYHRFVERFVTATKSIVVGDPQDSTTQMGPVCHSRRLAAMDRLVGDACARGGRLATGGRRIGNAGYFFAPTVITDVPLDAEVMNEEPFGPIATIAPFDSVEDAIAEGNRLRYGLATYVYTRSPRVISQISREVHAGNFSVNHIGLALPEVPMGGVRDSGYGLEGGAETLDPYMITKFVTQRSSAFQPA
jgi:succinate-semialdehyde dehydrogenase/glutarate-semialdehyde dehydrogenase